MRIKMSGLLAKRAGRKTTIKTKDPAEALAGTAGSAPGENRDGAGEPADTSGLSDGAGRDAEAADEVRLTPEAAEAAKKLQRALTGETGGPEEGDDAETAAQKLERTKYKANLAEQIVEHVRSGLLVRMPFFNRAILKMPVIFYDHFDMDDGVLRGFGTDGVHLFCNPDDVLRLFRQEKGRLSRTYFHMVLHCLFSHPFEYEKMRADYWDLAADMAVEKVILDMKVPETMLPDDDERRRELEKVKTLTGELTAEYIYHYLCSHEEHAGELLQYAPMFFCDQHRFWIPRDERHLPKNYPQNPHPGINKISQEWKKLGKSVDLDVQVFEKNQGMAPGSLTENLRELVPDKYDYSEFLKKFAMLQEEVHINDDEFDYIYYNYGIELYGNMPLIEPLEYRETKKIHDFVIAIDTSGSCQGQVVNNFLNKTVTILKSTDSFFHDVNIYIIQCDSKIQEVVKITSLEEFDKYRETMKIKGFGGTDFRPVFRHIDGMRRQGELKDLRGLIYFTDGMGVFPERMPDYKTAFVFVNHGFKIPPIPSWAIKLVLQEDELRDQDGWKTPVNFF